MSGTDVVIIDLGVGNLFSLQNAFARLGYNSTISKSRNEIREAFKLVLPGVGAFGSGMKSLEDNDLMDVIIDFAKKGNPLLGICLGMEMFFSYSEEFGRWDGLGLIDGHVRSLKLPIEDRARHKVPQIGWNVLKQSLNSEKSWQPSWKGTVLDGLESSPYVYFIHSFIAEPKNIGHTLAFTEYGQDRFCSVTKKENITGCQFHPEISGKVGLKILDNFMRQN